MFTWNLRTIFGSTLLLASFLSGAATTQTHVATAESKIASDTRFYRHIMFRETPYASYRGIYPVESDSSPNFAHYHFERDDLGRTSRIRYQINNHMIRDNQVWDSFIWFAPEVRIQYQGDKEIHTYFDAQGEQVTAHGNVFQAHYSLDEQGRRKALHFYDKQGQASQSEWNIHRYEWRHDNGKVYEKRFDLDGKQQPLRPEFSFFEVELEYDSKGHLAFVRNLGTDGTPTNNASGAGIDRITYDHNGNFVRWQVYDKDGNPVEGNRPMVHLGEHLYDEYGNKVGLRGYDRKGNRIPFSWNALEHVQTYNAFGNQLDHIMYTPDGSLSMYIRREYNEDQTKVSWVKSLNRNHQPESSPMLRGAAQVQFVYNDDGSVSRHFFNADMTPFTPPSAQTVVPENDDNSSASEDNS